MLGPNDRLPRMKGLKCKLLIAGAVVGLLALSVANRLYRVSSREGVPMFSSEAFALGWPYWIGGGLGVVLYALYWFLSRNRKDEP